MCFRALGAGDWSTPASFGADVVFCLARFGSAAVRVGRFAGAVVFRVACFGAAVVRVARRFDRGAAVFRGWPLSRRFRAAVVLRRVAPLRTGDRGVSELHGPASNGPRRLRAALYVPAGAKAVLQSKSMSATFKGAIQSRVGSLSLTCIISLHASMCCHTRALHGRAFTGRVIVLRCAWLVSAWVVSA